MIAKPLDAPYVQNGRTMMKIKHERTADGELQHIGVSASFTANPDRIPGTQSRWSAGKDLGFTPQSTRVASGP